ncbi:MAG: DUF192 domain-containing protein [Burkholderiaceae bacterium]|nr:DUF192 domain-containing protein [Burkholderiaceae bacterium]
MTYIKTSATLLLVLALSLAQAQDKPQQLPVTPLTAGMHVIQAEVAQTPEQRAIGLMPTNAGMLFVFQEAGVQCFWMKNTLLPLSIAFVADDGSIVNIAEMQALSEASHCSAKPVRFALEMNQGWFAKRGIKAGTKLKGKPWPPG